MVIDMAFYATSPKNWTEQLANLLQNCDDDATIIVNSKERKELAERAAKRMGFRGKILIEVD